MDSSTKTQDREQWRTRILRALAELKPVGEAAERLGVVEERAPMSAASALEA